MQYRIEHESERRMRVRLFENKLTDQQESVLRYAFSHIKGVSHVEVYPATSGVAFIWDPDLGGSRELILQKLDAFNFNNVELFGKQLEAEERITLSEVKNRKLDPVVKRKMREKILVETAFDIIAPMPLQVGYHVYQLITLRGM